MKLSGDRPDPGLIGVGGAHLSACFGTQAGESGLHARLSQLVPGLFQLAEHVGIAIPTVRWHLENIFAKLNTRSRGAAAAIWRNLP